MCTVEGIYLQKVFTLTAVKYSIVPKGKTLGSNSDPTTHSPSV